MDIAFAVFNINVVFFEPIKSDEYSENCCRYSDPSSNVENVNIHK